MRIPLALLLLSLSVPGFAYDPDHVLEDKIRSGDQDARHELDRRVERRRVETEDRLNPDSFQIDDLKRQVEKMYDSDPRREIFERTIREGMKKIEAAAARDRADRAEHEPFPGGQAVIDDVPPGPDCVGRAHAPRISARATPENICAFLAYAAAFDALPPATESSLSALPKGVAWFIDKRGDAYYVTYEGASGQGRPGLRFSGAALRPLAETTDLFELSEKDGVLRGFPARTTAGVKLEPFEARRDGDRLLLRFYERGKPRGSYAIMVLETIPFGK
ncbi:MAG: hypothetical protein Q8T11_10725 [Elusimicrobiota bacterium]|nr:hypothetical protein [Elusimicrobiota bacterium]